jgi:protein phosphatase
MSALQQLSALSSRFAKTNLAARATLRLDDEFGALPFSEEVKTLARKLSEGEFAGVGEIVAGIKNFAPPQKMETALLSDVGMERELNEDCGLIWKSSRAGHARNFELELLAVADGMGGHEGGEVASDLTLYALESAIAKRQNLDFSDNSVVLAAMNEVLVEVNDAVVRLTENPPYASMRAKPGATLVCALRIGSRVFLGNVGDSRAYRWNEKSGLQRLTKDHSYIQDLLDSGSISEDEAWGHPDGSVITSHIGMMRGLKKDVFLRLLGAGDRLVLVSDGVVDTLRDAQIEAIVAKNEAAASLCAALVNAANEAGGFDNITVAALLCQ